MEIQAHAARNNCIPNPSEANSHWLPLADAHPIGASTLPSLCVSKQATCPMHVSTYYTHAHQQIDQNIRKESNVRRLQISKMEPVDEEVQGCSDDNVQGRPRESASSMEWPEVRRIGKKVGGCSQLQAFGAASARKTYAVFGAASRVWSSKHKE